MPYEIDVDNLEDILENLNKPAIPEGSYLAVVTGVAIHSKNNEPNKKSVKWDLRVNLSNPDEGWDEEGRQISLFPSYYTPLGTEWKDEDGETHLKINEAGLPITLRIMRALTLPEKTYPPVDAVGRLLRVNIAHEERNVQGETVYSAKVKSVRPYINAEGVQAPKIDLGSEEADAEEVVATTEF